MVGETLTCRAGAWEEVAEEEKEGSGTWLKDRCSKGSPAPDPPLLPLLPPLPLLPLPPLALPLGKELHSCSENKSGRP